MSCSHIFRDSFSAGVASLAMREEKRQMDFQTFMAWYEQNGPYEILIDGANVAFYGQNREGGGFSWSQIMSMVNLVKKEYPTKKVLLVSSEQCSDVIVQQCKAVRSASKRKRLFCQKKYFCKKRVCNFL